MDTGELRRRCPGPEELRRCLGVAAVWPLWESVCKRQPSWGLAAQDGTCTIFAVQHEPVRVIVPSGNVADAIRRAYLLAEWAAGRW